MSFRYADSVTIYNKGVGVQEYLYYNPSDDSAILRMTESINPDVFKTYAGQFKNKHYTDTIGILVALLKRFKNGDLPHSLPSESIYCGPKLSVEYNDNKGSHFNSFILSGNDTLRFISRFFYNLDKMPWNKKSVQNGEINETKEAVSFMKALGRWDSIAAPYIPLPYQKGIDMELLYGKWRTIENGYKNDSLNYWTRVVSKNGTWVTQQVSSDTAELKYSGKVIEINKKNNLIRLKSKFGITTLKVLNLTENCFEYEEDGRIWRLDRMKKEE